MSLLAMGCALASVLALVTGAGWPRARRAGAIGRRPQTPGTAPPVVTRVLAEAGSTRSAAGVWRTTLIGAAATGAGGGLIVGPAVPLLIGSALVVAPPALCRVLRQRRIRRRDALLADWLEALAAALRAGASPSSAVTATAALAPWPLCRDLERVERSIRHGSGMARGLRDWQQAADATPAITLVTNALDLGLRSGGELARSVDRIAATLRDRAEAQAEVRALATQARASAMLLAVAPVGFALLLATIEPAMLQFLLTTPVGLACLVGGLGLEALGAAWMARIMASAS